MTTVYETKHDLSLLLSAHWNDNYTVSAVLVSPPPPEAMLLPDCSHEILSSVREHQLIHKATLEGETQGFASDMRHCPCVPRELKNEAAVIESSLHTSKRTLCHHWTLQQRIKQQRQTDSNVTVLLTTPLYQPHPRDFISMYLTFGEILHHCVILPEATKSVLGYAATAVTQCSS